MKKKLLNWTLAVSAFVLIAISSCNKENSIFGCPDAMAKYTEALEEFNENPSQQTCEALKDALQGYINTCAPTSQYQDDYDNMDCSGY